LLRRVAAGVLRRRREHHLAAEHAFERVVGADRRAPVRRAQQTAAGPVADYRRVGATAVAANRGYARSNSLVARRERVVESPGVLAGARRGVTGVVVVGVPGMEIFHAAAQAERHIRHLVRQRQVEAVDMGAAGVAGDRGGAVERADLVVLVVI